ncbi:outer membrane protein assembly factor BamE [Sphingomicrobium sp. XHP0235]|uniref:outer membrane protein assembly factor BamE n=1 Tax=Sphingomicrobium aquimarinum TaxID=3133971 RepID=UPI0031FEEB4A
MTVFRRIAILALVGSSLSACAGIRDNEGYVYNQELTQSLAPGVDNRDSVRATLGEPTFTSQFEEGDWYYVSRRTSTFAFRQPRLTDTRVIRVSFDEAGNVAAVTETGEERVASIDPEGDVTPTLGRQRSFFEELFGNIGSVSQGGMGQQPPQQ